MELFLLLPGGRRPGLAVRFSPPCRLATRTFRWPLEFELQAQLIPSNPMAVPGEDPGRKGESESSGTLHFLYVNRGCDAREVRAGSLLPAAAQGGKKKKRKKAPICSLL